MRISSPSCIENGPSGRSPESLDFADGEMNEKTRVVKDQEPFRVTWSSVENSSSSSSLEPTNTTDTNRHRRRLWPTSAVVTCPKSIPQLFNPCILFFPFVWALLKN